MPILNYTTKISASRTIGEITEILVAHGATKVVSDFENGTPSAVSFALVLNGQMTFFSLPANYKGVLVAMKKDPKVKNSLCTPEQAVKVAWRTIKDWIEAQCAFIDSGLVELPEVFLPYAITKKGTTLYKEIQSNSQLLLTEKTK